MIRVAVLLSLGRHPASGRARRALLDAQALEMALAMPDAEIHAIHAGDAEAPALRDYLGMGLDRLTVLAVAAGHDPVPVLADHLIRLAPDLVLCGEAAETDEASGMVPYLVAEALGSAVVSDVAAIVPGDDGLDAVQALLRGRRRQVTTQMPAVAIVNAAAPAARSPAFARARSGAIDVVPVVSAEDAFLAGCEVQPWRARPKRMAVPAGGSALERMKAMTEAKAGEGRVLIDPDADEAAAAIYDYLVEKRFVVPGGGKTLPS